MSTNIDLTTLAWCLPEIRSSMQKAEESLQAFYAQPEQPDTDALGVASKSIQQAHGALRVLSLQGVELLTQEAIALIDGIAKKTIADGVLLKPTLTALQSSFSAVIGYLESLERGEMAQPIYLFVYYRDILLCKGVDRVHPAELFFPTEHAQLQTLGVATEPLDDATRAQARMEFERGLLKFLRGTASEDAYNEMFSSVAQFEAEHRDSADRNFWLATLSFFEGLKAGAFDNDVLAKKLLARLNIHMKTVQPNAVMPDKLFKEVLFSLACASKFTPMVSAVREAYGLDNSVPRDYDKPKYALLDRSALAIAKDSLAKTKALLDKIVRGSNDDIAAFCSAVELFAKATTQLPVGGLQPSAKGLQMASGSLRSSAKEAMANESMLLELATITLFAETILDEGVKASEEQNGQGKELAQRVELAVQGRLGKDVAMPVWLQVLSQSAQERITVATFINEAQINLRNVEKALDTFFRDPDDKKELTPCGGQLRQVAGALALLGHGHAMSAAQALATQVDKMVEATETPSKAECDKVAESLGTLGFFVDRLGQKDESAGNFKFDSQTGTFAAVNSADASAATAPAKVVQIQMASIARTIKPVEPVLVAPPAPAPAPAPVPELKFPDVVAPAIVAAAFVAPMIELPTELPPVAAPVAKVEVAVKAELSQEDAEAAQELREIFLMEAQEVLEAIETHTVLLRKEPTSDDHMTTIRRAFHTLKGSSRMVGLDQFGTAGWAMEQLLNLWLSEKRAATDELFALIDHSHGVFTGWTTGLEQGDESCVHPEDLVARADALREGHAFVAPTVAQAAPVAAPIVEVMVESISEQTIVEESEALAFDELSFDEPVFDVTPPVDIVATLDAPAPVEVSAFESPVFGELTFEDVEAFRVESAPDPIVIATPEVIPEPVFEPAFDAEFELDSAEPEAALFADDQPKESEDLQIGDNTISRALFNIFLSEADDMLAVLRSDADDWQLDASRSANKEARRAVHSIAGSANLVGLSHVSEVAHQVDLFLQRHLASGLVASVKERAVYLTVVERLAGMLHQFAGGHQPADNADLFDDAVALAAGIHADAPLDIDVLDFDQMEVSDLVKADMMEVNEASDESALFAEESAFAEDVFASDEGALFAEELVQPAVAVVPAVAIAAFNEERRAVPRPPQENLRDDEYSLEENHFDADLLPVFIEEAEDYLPKIAASLRQWLEAPDSQESPRSLMRYMHTVKGSARMAGAMELGQRVHEMETRIEHATDAASVLADGEEKHSLIEALLGDHDHVIALFDKIKDPSVVAAVIAESNAANAAATANEASEIELFASDEQPAVSASLTAAAVVAAGAMTANALSHSPSAQVAATAPAAAPVNVTTQLVQGTQQAASAQLVRVRADLLDRMVSDAGEASIARSRVENELTGMRSALSELSENVSRLRTQLREIEVQAESQIQARIASSKESHAEFDPLEFDRFTRFQEVSRMLAESVNDVATVQQNSMRGLDEANRDLQRQSQVMRELQQNLMRIRLVQVGSISERLYRVVRQAAKETGKKVNLDIRGSATEIDRSVLERMASAFEHLLRNAVAHGIETPDVRTAARKIETGEIVFEIKQVGNEIVVALSDNGAGLDYPRIRERAIAKGMIVAGSNPSERELGQMIFMPGFSTATNVTEIAGRGVGMDVVRSEVAALGGRLDTESTTGLGTRFTITLPLSLAVTQVVVIESGQYRFAVASSAVEQVLQLKPQALVAAYADQGLEWLGERVPVVHLASLLDLSDKSPVAQHYSPVLIVKIGERRIAVHVDSVSKNQEVVLKNMGPQLARVNGVVGATVMGNGDIVLIINPVQFADQMDLRFRTSDEQRMAQTLLRDSNETFTVMVVDDSVTVRKVSQRFLQREGYEVILAKDGVDALRQLQDHMPDVMLVDIEMPRMDGYDLTRAIRADQRLKHIPIVMITSRTADKHRNYALSLGVNAYMGKPYSEADLAETIKSYIGQGAFTKDVAAISN